MGLVFSGISLACCCGAAAVSCCCSALPSCKNSTSARIMYAVMLLFTTIISCVMLSPKVEELLQKIHWLCDKDGIDCVGYMMVYRIEFGAVMFFILMAVIMLGVKSSKDTRSSIQNGFWGLKFILLIGIIVGAFFIPTKDGKIIEAWMYIGLVGAFCFILLQLILLVDFAHAWNETWVDNMEESGSKVWFLALACFTFLMYAISIGGIVTMFVYYTQSKSSLCRVEKFIVSFQLVLSVLISIFAILPAVQERQSKSGLLQASSITLYTTYLTWSALSYSTSKCNSLRDTLATDTKAGIDVQSMIGVIVTFILVIFASIRTSSSSQIGKLGLNDETKTLIEPEGELSNMAEVDTIERRGQHVYDNESVAVAYSYTMFHIMMAFASLYIMMTITNWYKPTGTNFNKLSESQASFWIKISSSWLCIGLYVWTLLAPVIFSDRDFN